MVVFLHTYFATDHFEGATLHSERTSRWWHLCRAKTCRRLTNIWCVYILIHVDLNFNLIMWITVSTPLWSADWWKGPSLSQQKGEWRSNLLKIFLKTHSYFRQNIKLNILDDISILFVVQHEILSTTVSAYGLHTSRLPSLIAITTSYFNVTSHQCQHLLTHSVLQCYFPHCQHRFLLQCDLPSVPAPFHTSIWNSHRCQHLSTHFMLLCDLPSLPAPLHTSIWSSIAASTCRCTSCFNVSFHRCQYLSKHPLLGHLITTVVTVTYILGISTLIF